MVCATNILRHALLTLVGLVLVFTEACNNTAAQDYYSVEQITINSIEIDEQGKVHIDYVTMSETLYYCPEILMEKVGQEIHLKFPRVHINADYQTKAHDLQNPDALTVYLADDTGKAKLIWERAAATGAKTQVTKN